MRRRPVPRARGFSLVELLTALAILMIVCGVAFEMLTLAMKRYHADSQLLNTFQEARFGLDQMVRDINDAGYPPRNEIQSGTTPSPNKYAATAFAWGPSGTYPNSPCTIGTPSCSTPNGYDLIVETELNPNNPPPHVVQWVRYKLIGTTLYRGVLDKSNSPTADPDGLTSGFDVLVPYVQNVMNNAPADQIAAIQTAYSNTNIFPGGQPVPIFKYICESADHPRDCTDTLASTNDPTHVVSVIITLIVQAPTTDIQTGRPLVVQLKGQGRRVNPDY
ncbi:MAG TPA: prepilin-type N-terminal cleavage/methylation domain-containing protein [Candidatus Dormibacteraeota bacterium]|jgi:prepilin-type N-terminal cleavage/methylation domain-containing protein|nr:prepilin-type N-terminal cleavage/methylation domain-containing protein [Candidatus Dormibacteraeota bacterium]